MSAILSVDDLNDFISPGVACIKPVETLPSAPPPPTDGGLEHEVILDGQQPQSQTTAPAQISLTDCLACSGCVTSAEAVLVSLQSHNEVLNVLDAAPALRVRGPDADGKYMVDGLEDDSAKLFVASVSPQTRASLAAACGNGVTEQQAGRMIEQLFMGKDGLPSGGKWGNGFTWMVDTNTARQACLVLGADEVLGGALEPSKNKPVTPILTSSCPGWVCYAEKTHPYVLPHLSRVKSPQAITGTLLKTVLSRKLGISPDRIWHLAIMPCFDKKLEASREELTDAVWNGDGKPGRGVRDVDCVITSKEILMLAASRGIDFFGLSATAPPLPQPSFPDPTTHNFLFPPKSRRQSRAAGTSGGNLHFILREVQSRHPGSQIQTIRGRNADVDEYTVNAASGETIFRAARYYGFRNIQNLVRKLKPSKPSRMPGGKPFGSARRANGKPAGLEHAYVEVMACPGGCTNGGGQIKIDDEIIIDRKGFTAKPGPQEQKEWLAEVDEAYFSADEPDVGAGQGVGTGDGGPGEVVDGISPSYIRDTLAHWSSITGIGLDRLVYTSYREVISDVGKSQTETERVVQLAGKIGGGW
ncbi:Cytosolic Fe-S cluster assembly factor nar-1 [Diplogelasinospora grovesii]|uniref:Cytosolic Fe-S cluster assembly factor NAR1 n=1 Tax=Diplogelasinospora grovesii TaxID=303347 RepID=A0AAN6N2I3_9PEZI|nr:Cytosolic Fe-S cluster assembly factor nar-1 [Diplogelasinospora grovesii]